MLIITYDIKLIGNTGQSKRTDLNFSVLMYLREAVFAQTLFDNILFYEIVLIVICYHIILFVMHIASLSQSFKCS